MKCPQRNVNPAFWFPRLCPLHQTRSIEHRLALESKTICIQPGSAPAAPPKYRPGYEKMRMHWVAGVWHTGHSGSADWQICPAQSMQKRLCPQGTRAAITSLSKHT